MSNIHEVEKQVIMEKLDEPKSKIFDIKSSYWFSKNPDKAWGEKFYLIYSPIWMIITGIFILQGLPEWGNWGQLGFCLLILVPMLTFPAIWGTIKVRKVGKKWYQAYWLKFHIWMWIFAIWGGYFFNEYWFDLFGAHYYLPNVTWNINAALVGLGGGVVPITMFLLAVPYLTTYHVTAVILIRKVRTMFSIEKRRSLNITMFIIMIILSSLFWAFTETIVMTTILPSTYFGFVDLKSMLTLGTVIYACYYFVTFPLVYYIDENKDENWPIFKVIMESLAAGMIIFFIFEIWAHALGTIF